MPGVTISSTTLTPPSPQSPRSKPTRTRGTAGAANYTRIIAEIKAAGLLHRRTGYYITLFAILMALTGGLITGFILLGDSWFQLLIAAGLAVILTQISFITHEAAHRQVFTSGPTNDRVGRILANAFVGISYQWWMNKHTKHHANPNTVGKDPDIDMEALSFTTEQAQVKTGFMKWLVERQGYAFFPLLTLEGLNLHLESIKYLFVSPKVKNRAKEITTILLRLSIYFALIFWVLPLGLAFAFIGVQMAVFGVYMGASFAPNHKGMPLIGRTTTIDFFSRQVLTSRNIGSKHMFGNRFLNIFYGGLNYQVEHHLFPSMPRPNLHAASVLVRKYCEELSVPYTVTTMRHSYAQVITYLNKVGLSGRDPFECPMVADMRPQF
ncbi:acyl-CoA desaturase [Jonesiaceae bacterium BS-20]|uniref:Acyl-CoA desaturase n=1 Tax=Jonesiaceae bacterium BS-20 TaxID=3120821 RepID=A0AAU7DXL0_9MICO